MLMEIHSGCKVCDFLLYVPWAMATSYVDILKEHPPTYPSDNNGHTVQVPPFSSGRTFHAERYHAQNPSQKAQTELREILPNFSMLSLMLRGGFIEDEILHAARHILENHNAPIWVSLALQIQLDIHRLGSLHSINAFQDLKNSFQVTKSRCEKHQKWSKSLGFEVWKHGSEEHVQIVARDFGEWIEGSKCGKADRQEYARRVAAGQSHADAINASKRVPLLEYFPVTCGTMKTEIQLEFHVLGLRLINETGHVPMLCHLYNALSTINPDAPIWPDMELLIRNQGPAKVFVGSRPSTLEDAYKRLYLAMGMSATSLARDSKGMHFNRSIAKQREFGHSPIVQNLFDRWMGKETRKIDEAAYQLQRLLFDKSFQHRLKEDMYMTTASDSDPLLSRLIPVQSKLVRTLSSLSQAFTAEMPAIAFDYFSFERRCFKIFLQLNKEVRAKLSIPEHSVPKKERSINGPVSTTVSYFAPVKFMLIS